MRKRAIIAVVSLLMGALLQAGCDEADKLDAADMLLMSELANSKYYLRFDVDYDNDSVVDEHVEMRLKKHFDYIGSGLYRYESEFRGKDNKVLIDLPKETNSPVIYGTENMPDFNFLYRIYNSSIDDYRTETVHDFTFQITEWGGSSDIIMANFSGYLVLDDFFMPTTVIQIINGELYARITDYND